MTDREWIRQTLAHRDTGAVPYNFLFSPPAAEKASKRFGDDIEEALRMPIRSRALKSVKPFCTDPAVCGPVVTDEFGIGWSSSLVDRGAPLRPCLVGPSLSGYRFPDPALESRYEGLAEWSRSQDGHFRKVWAGDLWERAVFMRGMEPLLLDLELNPGFVHELLRGLCDYLLATMELLCGRYEFEAIAIGDDYGTQRGMIMSPAHWRRFIRPLLAEVYAFAHQRGRVIQHHSCGHVVPIIPDLIEMGLDILHPIQPEAMDISMLKREFGADLTLCGGFPTQRLLVSGSPAEIRREVRRLQSEMGSGGGYILEPGLTIQPDVPEANIIALVEEVILQCCPGQP